MLLACAALWCTVSAAFPVRAEFVASSDELFPNDSCESHHVSLLQEKLVHIAMGKNRVMMGQDTLNNSEPTELRPYAENNETRTQQFQASSLWPLWVPLVGVAIVNVLWLLVLYFVGSIDDEASEIDSPTDRSRQQTFDEPEATPRDVDLDHLKWILVGLICLLFSSKMYGANRWSSSVEDCYFWQTLSERLDKFNHWDNLMVQLLVFVHIFVTPSFCFLSGHFSRSYVKHEDVGTGFEITVPKNRLQSKLVHIMLICLLAEFWNRNLFPALGLYWFGVPTEGWQALIKPLETLPWYLCALVAWRVFLPLWGALQYPMSFAFALALIPAFCPSLLWTWCRIFGYLPFFVCGLQVSAPTLDSFQKWKWHQVGGVVVLFFFILLLKIPTSTQGFFAIAKYSDRFDMPAGHWGVPARPFLLVRPLLYYPMAFVGVGTCLSVGQLVLAGRWGPLLDRMSSRSLYVYLFHPCIVREGITAWGAYMDVLPQWMQTWWNFNVSLFAVILLSSFPVYHIISSICEPPLGWVFKEAEKPKEVTFSDVLFARKISKGSNR